jgi:hypothetical protein
VVVASRLRPGHVSVWATHDFSFVLAVLPAAKETDTTGDELIYGGVDVVDDEVGERE